MAFADELRKNTKTQFEIQQEKGIEYNLHVETAAKKIIADFKKQCMTEAKKGNRTITWVYKTPISNIPYVFCDSNKEYSNTRFGENLCVSVRNKLCNENFSRIDVKLNKLPNNIFNKRKGNRYKLEINAQW